MQNKIGTVDASFTSMSSRRSSISIGSARRCSKIERRRSLKMESMIQWNRLNNNVTYTLDDDAESGMASYEDIVKSSSGLYGTGGCVDDSTRSASGRFPSSTRSSITMSDYGDIDASLSHRQQGRSSATGYNLSTIIRAIQESMSMSDSDIEDGSGRNEVHQDKNKIAEGEGEERDRNEVLISSSRRSISSGFSLASSARYPRRSSYSNEVTRRASVNIYGGEGFEIGHEELFKLNFKRFDPWDITRDLEGKPFEFHILGTSADDMDCQPHVLSPPQMGALQEHLPICKRGESFWLKYSMVRDGANKALMLQSIHSEAYTIMAMETLDGEVFGAFTSSPWNIQHGCFGSSESFVWRLKHPREESDGYNPNQDILYEERVEREQDIEVYKFAFNNFSTQICTQDRIAVGGGTTACPKVVADGTTVQPHQFGFAICFDCDNLLEASTSPCLTFDNPSLCKSNPDGSKFELLNLEVWALTPCATEQDAHQMACQKLFLKRHSKPASSSSLDGRPRKLKREVTV